MKISLDQFRKYKKIILSITEKGNPYTESLYFDFQEGFCYFQNESVYSRIAINKIEEKNIFVDASKFLVLTDSIADSEIEIKDGIFYDSNDSKYKLGDYGELNFEKVNFQDYIEYKEYNDIINNPIIVDTLRQASSYILKEDGDSLNAVFLKDSSIVASNRLKLFECNVDLKVQDTALQENVLKFLFLTEDMSKTFKVKEKSESNKQILLSIEDECEVIINANTGLSAPPTDSEEFISQYNHDNHIVVNLKDFTEVVSFLYPFSSLDSNNLIYFSLKENQLKIEVKENDVQVTKYIEVLENNSSDITRDFLLCCLDLKTSLLHLEGDNLKIQVSEDSGILNFTSSKGLEKHIVLPEMI